MTPGRLRDHESAAKEVAGLSRRVAHATHALLCAVDEYRGPVTVAEVCICAEEKLTVRATTRALRTAQRHKLCLCDRVEQWWPTGAYGVRYELAERFLADTERADSPQQTV